jgi:DNA-binding response OmpR family regulator
MPAASILVVDDEANIRSSLQHILARDGYQVVTAESGEVALDLIATQEFDLALVDLKMKGIDGIAVSAALRQRSPQTIVIILTAHATLETAVEALRLGAYEYLFKPYDPAELRECVRKGLAKRQSEAQRRDLLRQLERVSSSLEEIRSTLAEQPEESPPIPDNPTDSQARFLRRGGLVVDLFRHVITIDGRLLELSVTEFDLLAHLIREAPQVIAPQELVRAVQGYDSQPWEASETVRQHVYRIRQKIQVATGRNDVIRTVRGVGYTIAE